MLSFLISISDCNEIMAREDYMRERDGLVYLINDSKPYTGKVEGYDMNDILEYKKSYINGKENGISE